VVTAVDRADADATGTASLSVAPASAITISQPALGGADQGAPYSGGLQATGGQAPYSWAVTSGALPAGLSLGTATGVISGTATTAGPSTFQVTVTDHAGTTATATYSLTVYPALMITTSSVGDGAVNQGYTETLQATGGDPPYSWAVTSGSLPTGLSLGASTGVISGTPTTPGTSTFQVTITDQLGGTTSATYELVVPSPPPPVVYVANSGDNSVSAIDPTTNAVTATIPVGSAPDGIAATPDGQSIYVSDSGDGDVSVISTATDTVVATISVGGEPTGLAVTPNGAYAYVANASAGDVTVISTSTNTVVATVAVGPALSTDPRAVAITPDGAFAYVADGYGDEVAVIDTSTNTAVADVPTNGFTADVAIAPDGTVAYATMYDTLNLALGGLETIDTSTDNITDTYGFGDGAYTLAISPDGQSAYVAQLGGQVSILSTAPLSVLANVPTSTGGLGVAVTPDGQSVYASGPGNVVSVISPSTDAVVASIPVGTSPDGVAITP
jgi:YVTN family beta-propeller protein